MIDGCERSYTFSTSVVSFSGSLVYLNGDPFVVKGMVPSFSQ